MHILKTYFFRNLCIQNWVMQKAIIEIKKPCRVDLNSMIPDEKGRFCNVCQTSVIDFTQKSTEEITSYFKTYKSEKTCGIFNSEIVQTGNMPDGIISYLYHKKLKFVAVLITGLLILTGCKTKKHVTSYGTPRLLDEKTNSIENVK